MMYALYQAQSDMTEPFRAMARFAVDQLAYFQGKGFDDALTRRLSATYEIMGRTALTHRRPDYGIATTRVGERDIAVHEEAVDTTPFCTLLHFRKAAAPAQSPVLLVAPLSGHFATLLRDTVRTMLPEHDVYITDWHNARDVSLSHGRFGLDEYIEHLMRFLGKLGPGAHLVAVCQPVVPALAAAALLAQDNSPVQPRSLTLMAGPIDTRVNPTEVDAFATSHPLPWFEQTLIGSVPLRFAGAFRRVYPGFLQLASFLGMNPERHIKSFHDLYQHIVQGETEEADTIRAFYEEYFAVMDLPAEFYLETVSKIFQDHELPLGKLTYRGAQIEPSAITRTALFTIEGERDDICSAGQTLAAHDLCTGIPAAMKRHHLQTGVGHYGVFAGRKWQTQIYPQLRDFIHASE